MTWVSEPACIDVDEVQRVVEELVPGASVPAVTVGATHQADEWQISIVLGQTSREIRGADCELLTEATALIIAVRIDAVAAAEVLEPATVQRPTPLQPPTAQTVVLPRTAEPEPAPEPGPSPRTPSPRPARRRPIGVGGVGVGGELGALPRGAVALSASGGIRWPRARVELGGGASFGPRATASRASNVTAAFRLIAGVARGCAVVAAGAFELPLCGGVEVGVLSARPRGLEQPRSVDALWLAPTLGLRVQRWWARRVAPGLFVDVATPLLRHNFGTGDAGSLHTLPAVVVRGGLELRLRRG